MPAGVFRGIPENRRTQPLQSMAAGFVFCPATAGGSGHCPSRQRRPSIHEEFRGFADLGRSSLWRPTVVDRTRGSNRVQAQPARRQQVAPGTAWPAMLAGVFRGIPENRRTQPLQSMAAGFVFCPATAGGSGHCPSRQRRPSIHEEFRGFADLGRSSLWRPTVVDRTRGSNRVQAQPARRQQVAPGTARPTRLSLPASRSGFCRPR